MDILGNELADSLAKESTLEPPKSGEVSLAYLKSRAEVLKPRSLGEDCNKRLNSQRLSRGQQEGLQYVR